MRMFVFPIILAVLLAIGAMGAIGVVIAFPELATVYPKQAVETPIAQPHERAGLHRADLGTPDRLTR